jgi:hypothetical protein
MHRIAKSRYTVSRAGLHTFFHQFIGDFSWNDEVLGIAHARTSVDIVNRSEWRILIEGDAHAFVLFHPMVILPVILDDLFF